MIVIIIGIIIAIVFAMIKFKSKNVISLGTMTVCTGAVKTGKSTLAVYLALRSYRQIHLRWWIARKIFKKDIEEPLLYSNIPLNTNYVEVTQDMLLRKVRLNYKSVVLLDEASLVADSQLIKDNVINKQLLKFFKLFGHETKGGTLIVDTQSISDLHYAIKRCICNYIYINKTYKYLPFLLAMKVQEQRYSDDGTVISSQTGDIDDNLKTLIIPKFVWKKFDCYAYSILTDNKPRYETKIDGKYRKDLKTHNIPSFRNWSDEDEK